MNKKQLFLDVFGKKWYIQGFNAYPMFLNIAGLSGFEMAKILGFGYSIMYYQYKNGYCDFHYLEDDFIRIWEIVKQNLKKDPQYIAKVAKKYDQIFSKHKKLFAQLNNLELSLVSEKELIKLFYQTFTAMLDACGIAHAVDPIGIGLENDFKEKLSKVLTDKAHFNEYYSVLTTPTKLSFLGQEEKELKEIQDFSGEKRTGALREHLQKYFWVNNSYAGPHQITINNLETRLKLLSKDKADKELNKDQLIKDLSLPIELKEIIELIDYATLWQDDRKKNILTSIAYLGQVVEQISIRTKIPVKTLYMMGTTDVQTVTSLKEIEDLQDILEERVPGVMFMHHGQGEELMVSGPDYQEVLKEQAETKDILGNEDLHGSIANKGTAVGKVVICKGLDAIKNVQKGDIIVASMTRPEFMPALKIAAGIVTDEGGITCHAAIISRELGIPCVVGTKIATKVLRDGMEIEVRANHGFVRVLS